MRRTVDDRVGGGVLALYSGRCMVRSVDWSRGYDPGGGICWWSRRPGQRLGYGWEIWSASGETLLSTLAVQCGDLRARTTVRALDDNLLVVV